MKAAEEKNEKKEGKKRKEMGEKTKTDKNLRKILGKFLEKFRERGPRFVTCPVYNNEVYTSFNSKIIIGADYTEVDAGGL